MTNDAFIHKQNCMPKLHVITLHSGSDVAMIFLFAALSCRHVNTINLISLNKQLRVPGKTGRG